LSVLKLVGVDWLPEVLPWSGVTEVVALDELHAVDRDTQLLCNELCLRREDALPEVTLSSAGRDHSIGTYGEP
jgi:hypothetical protein